MDESTLDRRANRPLMTNALSDKKDSLPASHPLEVLSEIQASCTPC